ncbi:branched-chain amino acid ABC transporter [Thalassolituus sp. HI0120]|nr:branched-chain amino acid ABC transporter [Thalassolituus sp. HI0120]
MTDVMWVALAITAAGTFAMRAIPLVWMQRHLSQAQHDSNDSVDGMPTWLGVVGPCVVAALAGSSMVPATQTATTWLATMIGVIVTLLVWYTKRSMGLPILAGVGAFGLTMGWNL